MMRGILVARVSTKKQAGEDRFSIESQFRMMRDCCERKGIEIVDERIEPGRSAFTPHLKQLPVLHQTLLDIEAGMANCLVMHETTRLARNEQLGNHLLDRLTDCGASFINSLMDIDYTTPEGRMFFNNEVAMAAYTSRKTSQHSAKGKREQFLQGLFVGQIPFGYIAPLNDEGKPNRKVAALVVPHEAEAIRKAYEDFALGKNAHAIAREWNDAGLTPRSTVGLDYFQPQTVRDILRNPDYLGYVTHLGETRRGVHQPIVTEEQFYAAQRPKQSHPRRTHPPRLLRGVATCPEGHRLYVLGVRHSPKDPYRKHYYYREPSPDFERACSQAGKLWKAGEPDAQVEALLKTMALDDDWLRYVEQQARSGPGRDTARERASIEAKLERLQGEYLEGRLSKEKWDRIFTDCHVQLAGLVDANQPTSVLHKKLESWVELWDHASAEARNETCRLVFQQAVIDFDKRELSLVPWPEFQPLFQARAHYVAQDWPARD